MTNLSFTLQSQIRNSVQSEIEFSVDFNDAWQWLDYSRKDNAKASFLNCGFIEGVDYTLLINQESVNHSTFSPQEKATYLKRENIYLTRDCLKSWAMMSNTAKGKEVRAYFIKCEQELKSIKSASVVKAPTTLKEAMKVAIQAIEAKEEAEQQLALAESKVSELTPKAEMYEAVCETGKNVKVGELAKILSIKDMGQNNMFRFLKKKGLLQFNNIPYQTYVNSGYFTCVKTRKGGEVYIVTLVTPKGCEYITKALLKDGYEIPSKAA